MGNALISLKRLSRRAPVAAAIAFTIVAINTAPLLAIADEIDRGSNPNIIVVSVDGVIRIARVVDFDDLHKFNVVFDNPHTDDGSGSGAVESLNVIWLGDSQPAVDTTGPRYKLPQPAEALRMRDWQNSGMDGGTLDSRVVQDNNDNPFRGEFFVSDAVQTNAFGLAYGVGVLGIEQQRRTEIPHSILGDNRYWATSVDNEIMGPKAGLIWNNRRGPWTFAVQSTLLVGFNSGQVTDSSKMGGSSVPGALNRPMFTGLTHATHVETRERFTPVGELRAQSRLRLTDAVSLCTTWSSLIVGNLLSENSDLRSGLPDPSFAVDNENLLVHQFYCGMEYVH